jgi:hypothetical protein
MVILRVCGRSGVCGVMRLAESVRSTIGEERDGDGIDGRRDMMKERNGREEGLFSMGLRNGSESPIWAQLQSESATIFTRSSAL